MAMTRDDLIRMARETSDIFTDKRGREEFAFDSYGIERFAALVAATEREACAKLCESADDDEFYFGRNYAEGIRARGQHD